MRIRNLTEIKRPYKGRTTSIVLPTSPCRTQGGSTLCWNFAGTNVVESNYLSVHPEVNPEQVSFSRRIVYVWRAMERLLLKSAGQATQLTVHPDGVPGLQIRTGTNLANYFGTSIDAIRYIQAYGLVGFDQYPTSPEQPVQSWNPTSFDPASLIALISRIQDASGVVPATTDFLGKSYTPKQLADQILGSEKWMSFALADGVTQPGWRDRHIDRDNHLGDHSFLVDRSFLHSIVRKILEAGRAMEVSQGGHSIMLYGADYDAQGVPVGYYIKDSYGDCFYKQDPMQSLASTWQLTTIGEPKDFGF